MSSTTVIEQRIEIARACRELARFPLVVQRQNGQRVRVTIPELARVKDLYDHLQAAREIIDRIGGEAEDAGRASLDRASLIPCAFIDAAVEALDHMFRMAPYWQQSWSAAHPSEPTPTEW